MSDERKRPGNEVPFEDVDEYGGPTSLEDAVKEEEIELVVNYLNGHLDPERVAAVRKRLDEDEAFRDLAAPLIMTWSIPKHIERFPRPAGEMEREWAKLAKRIGIDTPREVEPPKRKRWSNWKRARVFLLLMLGAYMIGGQVVLNAVQDQLNNAPADSYTFIPFKTGWISLGDGIEVQLDPDASLLVSDLRVDGMKHVKLNGMARFRVLPSTTEWAVLRSRALYIETSAGSVWAGESDFSVTARDSSTSVRVHPLGPRRVAMPNTRTVRMSSAFPGEGPLVALLDNEAARMVRGQEPQRLEIIR